MIPPLIALFAWLPISFYIFWRYPMRTALLANFLGGWAVLPTAAFTPTATAFPYWILGSCLPSGYFFTKASVTGMAGLIGILFFGHRKLATLRPVLSDIPMLVWCLVPLASTLANRESLGVGLREDLYQTLTWGAPYLAGRLYFSNTDALLSAARAFVMAGLAYVPVCLVESLTGPQLYSLVYGYQPFRWIGAQRYFGFRPIGFMEDGNQLGIWMATSALIAVWLWKRSLTREILGIPIAWVAGVLLAVTLLCQSAGSILLLITMLSLLILSARRNLRSVMAVMLLGIVTLIGIRSANVVSLKTLVKRSVPAGLIAETLKGVGRGSFGWRLLQDEMHIGLVMRTPILGSAKWNWWGASLSRPWSLWMLVFGMYGVVGLFALETLQLLPVARVGWSPPQGRPTQGYDLRRVLAAAILMSALDSLLNSSMILPLLILVGALTEFRKSASEVEGTAGGNRGNG